MKLILLSINPEWCIKILNGKKTIEIRKTAPKEWVDYLEGRTDKKPESYEVYIYCTKSKPYILRNPRHGEKECLSPNEVFYDSKRNTKYGEALNGKVIAKFTLREVERINCETYSSDDSYLFRHEYFPEKSTEDEILRKSCISGLEPYLDGCEGYAWYISDLEIFDKPKELSVFMLICTKKKCNGCKYFGGQHQWDIICNHPRPLSKAPQSWCYVEACGETKMSEELRALERIKVLSKARGMLNYPEIIEKFDLIEKALKRLEILEGGIMKDYSKCPKCGSTNIVWNRDIRNAFIQCKECGHYLRKGKNKFN